MLQLLMIILSQGHVKEEQEDIYDLYYFKMLHKIYITILLFWTIYLNIYQNTDPALDATFDHSSAAYLATGPVIVLPFIYPLLFAITPALSSQ
jgi:hypothetical protein